jgi:hypothetical protein
MPDSDWMKLSELLKRLHEQRERQAAMREARDRNNRNAHGQEVFRHRDLTPTKPAKLSF